jgi:hypothetical protein
MALDVMLCWRDKQAGGKIWHFLSNFSAINLLIKSHQAHQVAAHPIHPFILFIVSQWVYQMIIQAHLGIIIMALDVMLCWRDKQADGKIKRLLSNFSAKNLVINSQRF